MKILKYLLLFLVVQTGFAQQSNLFSQYMFNPSTFNPGYTGSRGVNSLFLQHRSQWVGIEGAPNTSFLNYQTYNEDQKVGYGFSFLTDKIGPESRLDASIDFAYHLPVSAKGRLAFGVKASANKLNVDFSGLNLYQDDIGVYQDVDRKLTANLGMGFYYYTDRFFAGASVPYIFENNHYDQNPDRYAKDRLHYYLMTGYVFDLSPVLKFKPTLFYRSVVNNINQLDVAANFLLNEKLQLGATYRIGTAYSLMAGFQVNPGLLVGYSYDRSATELVNFNQGSHELFVRYEFAFKAGALKIQSPRFF